MWRVYGYIIITLYASAENQKNAEIDFEIKNENRSENTLSVFATVYSIRVRERFVAR